MNPLHESRAVPCAIETTVGNRRVLVVVGGGFSTDGISTDGRRTTEVFDPDSGRWKLLDVLLPPPEHQPTALSNRTAPSSQSEAATS